MPYPNFTRRSGRVFMALAVAVITVPLLAERVEALLPSGQTAIATAGADASYQVMLGILPNSNTVFNIPSLPWPMRSPG